jgi:hypothetical protein
MKNAILILSDPDSGTQEALARAYNGCAFAYDCVEMGDDVVIVFLGTGARWPIELEKEDCPVHSVYERVKDKVAGVSKECAVVFGVEDALKKLNYKFLTDNNLPDTTGLASARNLIEDGYTVSTF